MKFDIKEVLVAGDRVIVRGEVTGTPAGELFGVPHTGKSFRMMAIDIQTIRGWEDHQDVSHGELAQRAWSAPRQVEALRSSAASWLKLSQRSRAGSSLAPGLLSPFLEGCSFA